MFGFGAKKRTEQEATIGIIISNLTQAIKNIEKAERQYAPLFFTESNDRKASQYLLEASLDLAKAGASSEAIKGYTKEIENKVRVVRGGKKGDPDTYLHTEELKSITIGDHLKEQLAAKRKKLKEFSKETIYDLSRRWVQDRGLDRKVNKKDIITHIIPRHGFLETLKQELEEIKKKLQNLLALDKSIRKEEKGLALSEDIEEILEKEAKKDPEFNYKK